MEQAISTRLHTARRPPTAGVRPFDRGGGRGGACPGADVEPALGRDPGTGPQQTATNTGAAAAATGEQDGAVGRLLERDGATTVSW